MYFLSMRKIIMKFITLFILITLTSILYAQQSTNYIRYNVESTGVISNGNYAPLWLTANRYGMGSNESKNIYFRTNIEWDKKLKQNWQINVALDLAIGKNFTSKAWIQQAYADISWKMLTLSIGSKERIGFPLEKNEKLTSGWMVEGTNMRPIPQIRGEIKDYFTVPGTQGWVSFKGHLCYGYFTDGNWQENFVSPGEMYTKNVLYHSKSLMIRLGNKNKIP